MVQALPAGRPRFRVSIQGAGFRVGALGAYSSGPRSSTLQGVYWVLRAFVGFRHHISFGIRKTIFLVLGLSQAGASPNYKQAISYNLL